MFGVFDSEKEIEQEDFDMIMCFDGSSYEQGRGAGVFFIMPQGVPMHVSFKLSFECTNNNVEYEALILGLKLTIYMKYEHLSRYMVNIC